MVFGSADIDAAGPSLIPQMYRPTGVLRRRETFDFLVVVQKVTTL